MRELRIGQGWSSLDMTELSDVQINVDELNLQAKM